MISHLACQTSFNLGLFQLKVYHAVMFNISTFYLGENDSALDFNV